MGWFFLAGFLNQPIQPVASWGWLVDPKRHAARLSYQALMLSAAIVPGRGVGSWSKPFNGFKGNGGFQTRQCFVFFCLEKIARTQQESIFAIFFWKWGKKPSNISKKLSFPQKMVHPPKKNRRGGWFYYWHSNISWENWEICAGTAVFFVIVEPLTAGIACAMSANKLMCHKCNFESQLFGGIQI